MKILIIEDEEPAALRLKKILNELEPDALILDVIVSVRSAVEWLKNNAAPDLILLDINLADGSSFEIFKMVEVKTPVIFITAYDEFAIQAFKVNSIDYLLKPIKKEELNIQKRCCMLTSNVLLILLTPLMILNQRLA